MRARISMRWTITLFTGFFLAVSLSLALAAMLREVERQWTQDAVRRVHAAAGRLASTSAERLRADDTRGVEQFVRRISGGGIVDRIVVVNALGQVVSDSAPKRNTPRLLGRVPSLKASPYVECSGSRVEVLMPIRQGGTTLGAVFARSSVHEHQMILQAMTRRGIAIGLVIILAACVMVYALADVIAAPLQQLADRMERITRAEPLGPADEGGCCEVHRMSAAFNRMMNALHRRRNEMRMLPSLGLAVSRSLDPQQVISAAVAQVEAALPGAHAQIWLLDDLGDRLVQSSEPPAEDVTPPTLLLATDSILARAFSLQESLLAAPEGDVAGDSFLAAQVGASSAAVVPLSAGASPVGVLVAFRTGDAPPLERTDLPFLRAAANQIALCLENARLFQRESHMASIFQRLVLPPGQLMVPGLDAAVRWSPAGGDGSLGGDFYDVIALANNRWAIVIGDVCGKGAEASAYTIMTKYIVRAYAHETASPAEILRRANVALHDHLSAAGTHAPMFVTVLCVVYEPRTGRLVSSHAGHPLGLLLRMDSGPAQSLNAGGPPLGVVPECTYDEQMLYLAPGDVVGLYTDGVVEAARNEHVLEPAHIAQLLSGHRHTSVEAAADMVMAEVARVGKGKAPDDITLLVLRARGDLPPALLPAACDAVGEEVAA